MRKVTHIVIHHNGVPGRTVDDIRRTHVDGFRWSDIGYHAVVHEDGGIHWGRPLERPGAHISGGNLHTLGVCWIGNGNDAAPRDAQWRSLLLLCGYWARWYDICTDAVVGHREWRRVPGARRTHKTCPGRLFDLDKLRGELRVLRGQA